jgi:hypothetical protein
MSGDRDTVREALYDAAAWQDGIVEACSHMKEDPMYLKAVARAKKYRALLVKRYGADKTPLEKMLDEGKFLTVDEIRKQHE